MFRALLASAALTAIVAGNSETPANYFDSIREWQKQRDAALRSGDSWLTLVGLFWLKPGENTIGSVDSNNFVLPKGSAPAHMGRLTVSGNHVIFTNVEGASRTLSYDEENPTWSRLDLYPFM